MHKLWRKSSIGWLPEVHGHCFEGQNQLLIKGCFECLQPMKPQHNARTCEEAAVVVIQQLCGYLPKKKKDAQDDQRSNKNDESVTNRFADLKTISTVQKHQTKVKSMCIVPVKVKSAPQEKDVLRYAMLDNFSQGSFIQEALVKKMQTSGRKTTLNLKTLNDEISESTTAIEGLEVP